MRRFRFPTFGLDEPLGLLDAWRALEDHKAMAGRSAADEAAQETQRETRAKFAPSVMSRKAKARSYSRHWTDT
jgi:hypothetical protein